MLKIKTKCWKKEKDWKWTSWLQARSGSDNWKIPGWAEPNQSGR